MSNWRFCLWLATLIVAMGFAGRLVTDGFAGEPAAAGLHGAPSDFQDRPPRGLEGDRRPGVSDGRLQAVRAADRRRGRPMSATRVPDPPRAIASCSAHSSSYAPSTVLRETLRVRASVRVAGNGLPATKRPSRIARLSVRASCSYSAP